MKCTYPNCKCIVSTSTSQPEPECPLGLEKPKEEEKFGLEEIYKGFYELYCKTGREYTP